MIIDENFQYFYKMKLKWKTHKTKNYQNEKNDKSIIINLIIFEFNFSCFYSHWKITRSWLFRSIESFNCSSKEYSINNWICSGIHTIIWSLTIITNVSKWNLDDVREWETIVINAIDSFFWCLVLCVFPSVLIFMLLIT